MNTDILFNIIQACRESVEPIRIEEVQELKYLINELEQRVTDIVDNYSGQSEKSKQYWSNQGLKDAYLIKGSYPELLEIITKILDILRGQPLEIIIQKNQRDSDGNIVSITTYRGKESDLTLRNNGRYHEVQYDLQKSLENLEKIQKGNEAFIKHYTQFYNIAQDHIKSTRSGGKWKKRINEGNIVEAFQRHMMIKHLNENIETASFSEPLHIIYDVIIPLYYTVENVPWWQQGDIGYLQVKANNLKLASQTSIRRVASKLKSMFKDLENFDVDEFNKMFTAKDQKEMIDFSELSEKEQKKLIDDIRNNPNLKNITIKMFNS